MPHFKPREGTFIIFTGATVLVSYALCFKCCASPSEPIILSMTESTKDQSIHRSNLYNQYTSSQPWPWQTSTPYSWMTNKETSHHACDCQWVNLDCHYGKTAISFSQDTPSLWAPSWHSSLRSWQCPNSASLCQLWEPALQPLSTKCRASCINTLSMKLSGSQLQNMDYTILKPCQTFHLLSFPTP